MKILLHYVHLQQNYCFLFSNPSMDTGQKTSAYDEHYMREIKQEHMINI